MLSTPFQVGGDPSPAQPAMAGGLGDLFSLSGGIGLQGGMYSAPKQVGQACSFALLKSCS